jgi:HIV Tat-specific factor 1
VLSRKSSVDTNREENNNNNPEKKKKKIGENIERILTDDQIKIYEKKQKKKDKQKEKKLNKWYTPKVNSNIYITDLPKDITEAELVEMFSKCGFIRKDEKGKPKIKLYKDESGKLKGDGLISFLREESVQIAIDLYNDFEIKPGHRITIEKAKFEQKGNYKAREIVKIDDIQRYKNKTDVERLLGWNEEDSKGLKIVVLKHMFTPEEFYVNIF